jgi:hypothetical protein
VTSNRCIPVKIRGALVPSCFVPAKEYVYFVLCFASLELRINLTLRFPRMKQVLSSEEKVMQ